MNVKRGVVFRQRVEEIELFGDIGQDLGALLQKRGDGGGVDGGAFDRLTDEGLGSPCEVLGAHCADVFRVKIPELFNVENRGGLGDALDVEYFGKLLHGEYLALAAGAPAEQRNIVDNGVGEIALRYKILIRGVAVAL